MSTFIQLVQRFRTEAGASGSGPITVVGQTGELGRLVNWLNTAWLDIQMMRRDWEWMRKSCAFTTVAGQATYTPAQCGVTDFGMWARNTFRNYANPAITLSIASPCTATLIAHRLSVGETISFATSGSLPTGVTAGLTYYVASAHSVDTFTFSATSGGAAINSSGTQSGTHTMTSNNVTSFVGLKSEVFMEYLEYDTWRDSELYGALRSIQTRPLQITITPNKSLGLGPIADAGYTVVGDYYSVPSEMTADADVPALPTQFHMAIVYRALMSYGLYEGAPEAFNRGQAEFNKMMRRIVADRLPEISQGGALA